MTAPAAVPAPQNKTKIPIGLIAGFVALIAVLLMPLPADLPVAGHRMLAILAFAVVVWITEAVSYEASAIMITTLMAFLLGTAPTIKDPQTLYGTSAAISMALTGFANSALALVTGALFIAAAMTFTGLDRRIALVTLSQGRHQHAPHPDRRDRRDHRAEPGRAQRHGAQRRGGAHHDGRDRGLRRGQALEHRRRHHDHRGAGHQHLERRHPDRRRAEPADGRLHGKMLGQRVAWSDWLIAGAPWSLIMSAVLVVVVLKMLPPESNSIAGGKEAVEKSLRELGPMTGAQKRLMAVSVLLLLFWATEGKLHKFDTTSTTYFGLVLLMLPRFGVMTWKDVQSRIPWGTVIVFGVGISLGTALLTTQAGQWLGNQVVAHTGLDHLGPLAIFAILSAFLIVIHLGFASATALTSAMLPILISVLATLPGEFSRLGMTMLLGFVVSYGFILPINAPQNMVCLGTETFNARQFAKVGIVITIVGYLLMLLFGMTYWRWLGWL